MSEPSPPEREERAFGALDHPPPAPPAEVEAALYALDAFIEDLTPWYKQVPSITRVHVRAALALVRNRLATVTALVDAAVAREREGHAADLARYGADHVEDECRKWQKSDRGHGYTWLPDAPCTCGLADKLAAIRQAPRPGLSASGPQ